MAVYVADVLNQIGLKAKPRIVAAPVYFATIGNQKTRAQIGFTNWFQDFPPPSNFTFLVDGASIQNTNNQNLGNVDDERINAALIQAGKNPDLDAVADTYAAVDRRLLDEAHVAALGHAKLTVFYSDRIDFDNCTLWHPVYTLDLGALCLKP
jgi:peptide/nickel transport system substrate-binding protein